MTIDEQISATKLHSITQNITEPITIRPIRSPHHTASATTILGGGPHLNPGEISLAHTGVLFMDEFPEYRRDVLEALREPLENQTITVSYGGKTAYYPADFMLIAAMNPCHCGYLGSNIKPCTCSTSQLIAYRRKLSGPLLDRIDMYVEMKTEASSVLFKNTTPSTITTQSANVLISTAQKHMNTCFNGRLSSAQITKYAELNSDARRILDEASARLQLSARSYFKTLKVAKTIANLADSDLILPIHITEALRYRFALP